MAQDRGSTLLEALISLAVSLPLLTALAQQVHNLAHLQVSLALQHDRSNSLARVETALAGAVSIHDSHRFNLPPRVHPTGVVVFPDGTSNRVMQGTQALRPNLDSNAITTLELAVPLRYIIEESSAEGAVLYVTGCRLDLGAPNDNRLYRAYLAVLSNSYAELVTDRPQALSSSTCREFILRSEPSMSTGNTDLNEITEAALLIPIRSHYTLYIDSRHRLRHLGHSGSLNIENQPIVGSVEHLRLTPLANPVFHLRAAIKIRDMVEHDRLFLSTLSPSPNYNLLLGRAP